MSRKAAASVLLEYPERLHPKSLRAVGGAGGFSGSQLWRFRTPAGEYCLRCWPQETSHSKVLTIHLVLQHVHSRGFDLIPLPMANSQGQTLTMLDDSLWEVTRWLSGEPKLISEYTEQHLSRAAEQLARFHDAARSYQPLKHDRSPGLLERRDQLLSWYNGDLEIARQYVAARDWPEFTARAQQAFQLFEQSCRALERELRDAVTIKVPLQFCIRDVRAEHFLFQRDQVSGLIDFGAMRVECVAGDIARLVGTAGPLPNKWEVALDSYSRHCQLSVDERRLIPVFHRSGLVLATLNWIRWVAMDDRKFDDWNAVLARMDALLQQWSTVKFGQK